MEYQITERTIKKKLSDDDDDDDSIIESIDTTKWIPALRELRKKLVLLLVL